MLPYLLLILGLAVLLYGGKILVDGSTAVAAKLGMSAGLIGLTVVAFGTSAPELIVSVNAAIKGNGDISIGNVVGSNIANIGMVLGISGIFYPILIRRSVLRFDYPATLIITLLFFGLSYNLMIGLWEGLVLFGLFILLNWYFFKSSSKGNDEDPEVVEEIESVKDYSWFMAISLILGGVFGLYIGSELMVENAITISRQFGVSERVIGVTVIAIGTSLPELITSIMAALAKKTDMAIGNILGSNMMNILSIIGITAIIKPIPVAPEFIHTDYLWMIGFTLILFPLIRTRMKVSKIEGFILFAGYVGYIIYVI